MSNMKLVGYMPMKEDKGKVLFVVRDESKNDKIIGNSVDKVFAFGELAKVITANDIGKSLICEWEQGYNGKAVLSGLYTK